MPQMSTRPNNQGDPRAVMGVNAFGNGVVATWDKNGYRQ